MAAVTKTNPLAPLLAAINTLDEALVMEELAKGRVTTLFEETEVYSQLWRAAHHDGTNAKLPPKARETAAAAILRMLCESGINPLIDTQMALSPYIVDWARQLGAWKDLELLVNQNSFTTTNGGGWIHALCENGAFNLRAIITWLERAGYPGKDNGKGAELWSRKDREGLSPLEVLWIRGGWADRGSRPCGTGQPPGDEAIAITQWCKENGMDPEKHTPQLTFGMRSAMDTPAFNAPNGVHCRLQQMLAQWQRERLMKTLTRMPADQLDTRGEL